MSTFPPYTAHAVAFVLLLVGSIAIAVVEFVTSSDADVHDVGRAMVDAAMTRTITAPTPSHGPASPASTPATSSAPTAPALITPDDAVDHDVDPDVATAVTDFRAWFDDTFADTAPVRPDAAADDDTVLTDDEPVAISDELRARIDALLASIATRG